MASGPADDARRCVATFATLFSTLIAMLLMGGCAGLPQRPALEKSGVAEIDATITSFIDAGKLPGATFHLERLGDIHKRSYGKYTFEQGATPVSAATLFDAASLTKVLATAPAIMLLVEQGKIALDSPLLQYLPECAGGGKDAITVRHLLTHTSGLPSGLPAKPAWRGQDAALKLACSQVATHAPGSFFRYSDINFILLGFLVQRASGMPLDEFASRHIFAPLKMHDSGYLPLKRFPAARIAPTQQPETGTEGLHDDLAGARLQGVVHDPTVRFMGGVGGSAGVFTTATDVARYARMLLNGGELDGIRVLSADSVRMMSTVQSPPGVEARRSAGWDIDTPYSRPRGSLFPAGSYGHTGFTGCILWIDPFSKTFYVFLSNRVYPNDRANILELYSRLGTLSARAVKDFDFTQVNGALQPTKFPPPPAPSLSPSPR